MKNQNKKPNSFTDFAIVLFIVIIGGFLCFWFDIYEKFHNITAPLEHWELDEFGPILLITLICLVCYSWRRLKESKYEIAQREKVEKMSRWQANIIDQIHDAVVSIDTDGYITSWNKSANKLFGYSAQEVIGKNILSIFPKQNHGLIRFRLLNPLKSANIISELDLQIRNKSKQSFDTSLTMSNYRDTEGTVVGKILCFKDVTEHSQPQAAVVCHSE